MKKVQFADSAFRHGFSKEDFFELIAGRYLKLRSQKGLQDVYELFGQNLAGDYMYVIYRVLRKKGAIRIFHMGPMSQRQKQQFKRMIKK